MVKFELVPGFSARPLSFKFKLNANIAVWGVVFNPWECKYSLIAARELLWLLPLAVDVRPFRSRMDQTDQTDASP